MRSLYLQKSDIDIQHPRKTMQPIAMPVRVPGCRLEELLPRILSVSTDPKVRLILAALIVTELAIVELVVEELVIARLVSNAAEAFLLSDNLAAVKSSIGQPSIAQASDVQHPRNGVMLRVQVYHSAIVPVHIWGGISSYSDLSKLEDRKSAWGHKPSTSHRLESQQPMNHIVLP